MPEQPHPAEEKLQRYARERRAAGGDFALHPATRRLLQGEVARQFGAGAKPNRSGLSSWFNGWRTLAISCGLFALLGVSAWIFLNHRNAPQLAKVDAPAEGLGEPKGEVDHPVVRAIRNSPASPPAPQDNAPVPASAPQAEALVAKREVVADPKQSAALVRTGSTDDVVLFGRMDFVSTDADPALSYTTQERMPLASASRSAGKSVAGELPPSRSNGDTTAQRYARSAPSQTSPVENNYALQNNQTQMRGGVGERQQAAPAGATPGPEARQALGAASTAPTQNMANQAYFDSAGNLRAEDAPKQQELAKTLAEHTVMSRFSIEAVNGALRITDSDGSVYEGSFGALPAPTAKDVALKLKQSSALTDFGASEMTFHASGTNKTLNQMVVVEAKLASPSILAVAGSFVDAWNDKKLAEREIAIQAVPPAAPVPSTTPLSAAKPTPVAVTSTNVTAVEGTWRIGTSTRPFRATRVTR